MTPADLRKWLGQYDATPPQDARRRQAIREGLVLHTPDLVRELLVLREALEEIAELPGRRWQRETARKALAAFDKATGGGDD